MAYTWGYIKRSALAKLDLDESEANTMHLLNRFTTYANEVITQVCSAVKPKPSFFTKTVTKEDICNNHGEYSFTITEKDFISFGSGINTITVTLHSPIQGLEEVVKTVEAHNNILNFSGYNTVTVKAAGTYKISYNARWIDFSDIEDNLSDTTVLDVPNDILDCIPSYIASQCYGIDDEYRAAKYRNEFEMLLARIDNRPADGSSNVLVEGDW